MWMTRRSSTVRPIAESRSGRYTRSRTRRSYSGSKLVNAATRYTSPSPARDIAVVPFAEVDGAIDDSLEDRFEVEGRLGDRLYHVANRSFTLLCASSLAAKVFDLFAKCVGFAHCRRASNGPSDPPIGAKRGTR
jgi:hypothetical protein